MKDFIKKMYSSIAKRKAKSCCGPVTPYGSGTSNVSEKIGYTKDELESIPIELPLNIAKVRRFYFILRLFSYSNDGKVIVLRHYLT